MRAKNVFSLLVNSGSVDLLSIFHIVFPNTGPISQPSSPAPSVKMPNDAIGSIGTSFVASSANSGCVERNTKAPAMPPNPEIMLEASE